MKNILINSSYVEGNHHQKLYYWIWCKFQCHEIFKVIGLIFLIIIGKSTRQEYIKNNYIISPQIQLKTNFDLDRIKTLYSNLSALDMLELFELRKNYLKLNYSITDINLHILKIASYPILLLLISIFAAVIMLNIKQVKSSTFKFSIGIFFLL